MAIIIILLIIIIIILCPSILGIPIYVIGNIVAFLYEWIVPISICTGILLILYAIDYCIVRLFIEKTRITKIIKTAELIIELPILILITCLLNFNGIYLLSYILLFSALFVIANQWINIADDIFTVEGDGNDPENIIMFRFAAISLYFVALIFMYELQFFTDNDILYRESASTITTLLTTFIFPLILLFGFIVSLCFKKWYIPLLIIIGLWSGNYLHKSYTHIWNYVERQKYDDYTPTNTIEYPKRKEPYQGSQQQKDDLEKIDKYMEEHPDF